MSFDSRQNIHISLFILTNSIFDYKVLRSFSKFKMYSLFLYIDYWTPFLTTIYQPRGDAFIYHGNVWRQYATELYIDGLVCFLFITAALYFVLTLHVRVGVRGSWSRLSVRSRHESAGLTAVTAADVGPSTLLVEEGGDCHLVNKSLVVIPTETIPVTSDGPGASVKDCKRLREKCWG